MDTSFQRIGSCPAGYLEQKIMATSWEGKQYESGWVLCSRKEDVEDAKETYKPVGIRKKYAITQLK